MRWPWVSRELYERVQQECAASVNVQLRLLDEWQKARDQYGALLDKYHALKLQGAVIVTPTVVPERKEQDEVTRRINILSVGRPGLRAQMLRQVESDRTLHGMSDIAILQRIEAGVTADEGIPA